MDNRKTSADFYPGGKTPVTAGGGITSGEAGGAAGEPMVPVTKVEQLPEHYRESDMRSKINELARVISGGVAAIMAMVSLTLGAEPVKVLGAKKDALWNDDFVVTNVVADFAGFATTNTVTGATNALAATFVRGLEVATNAVLQAGAKEIAAATNALSQSVDERLKASTNGSFSASSLEPYAKRTWVEAQGYLKSTNLTGYAQVNWVQNQGFIKKEDASGDIARIVDEKIAAQDETAAYRLMSADGSQWIDGTGVCWRVRSHVCVDNGAEMSSDGFVQEWQNEETSERVSFSDNDGIRRWEYCKVLTWSQTPDDPDSTWETVEYIYECETNLTAGTAILGLEIDNPLPDQNGVYPPERVILKYWLTTNAVTRLATTNDMPKVDISGLITTNDVCAIVTNEVAGGWNEWVHGPKVARVSSFFCAEETSDYSYWVLEFYDENERWVIIQGYGDAPKKEDVFEIRWTDGPSEYTSAKSVRQRQPSRNALGLAMAKDVEKKFAEATNAIASIVTNEVAGYTEWSFSCEVPEIQAALNANPPGVSRMSNGDEIFHLYKVPVVEGYQHGNPESWDYDSWDNPTWMSCGSVYYNDDGFIAVVATRKSITRNALGLATLKDIESVVTRQELTNAVRTVVNAAGRYVWDRELEVCYRLNPQGGFLDLIAVTNIDLTLPENHLALETIENEWRMK